MKQSKVQAYFRPKTLSEAVAVYSGYAGSILVVAGGTDVFATDHLAVEALLDISGIGIAGIAESDGMIHIGATTTFAEIIKSELIRRHFTALWEASKRLADMMTRNMATIGGNLCTALPSGDSIPPLYAADAKLIVATRLGEKAYAITDFFLAPRKTVLQKGDILKEICVRATGLGEATAFEKMGRNSEDLAMVNVSVFLSRGMDGTVNSVRVAHGAVAPTVVRSPRLEAALLGKKLSSDSLKEYCRAVAEEIHPISNLRASEEYRRECSRVLTRRALLRAYEEAGKETA